MHICVVNLSLPRSQIVLKLLEFAMGKAQSKDEEYKSEEFQEAKLREALIGWKDIKIKIGVTGNSGVGKSSFINAIRGYGFKFINICLGFLSH